ncbi:MAG: phosphoesterase [Planctomycetota bacterium]|nr:phosphoesterase [Planctomycetota bacterium]
MEFVYVVPRERLFPDAYPQGLVPFGSPGGPTRKAFEAVVVDHGFFVEREYAERTPSLKQVIPYTVVNLAGEVLLMRRLKTGGEGRLHDKLSIGVGGHINPEDADGPASLIEAGTAREIDEEIVTEGRHVLSSFGLINDDSNPVGAVHVGLAQVLTVEGSVRIKEENVLEGKLIPPGQLASLLEQGRNFETWSSILIERLDELMPDPLPAFS